MKHIIGLSRVAAILFILFAIDNSANAQELKRFEVKAKITRSTVTGIVVNDIIVVTAEPEKLFKIASPLNDLVKPLRERVRLRGILFDDTNGSFIRVRGEIDKSDISGFRVNDVLDCGIRLGIISCTTNLATNITGEVRRLLILRER